MLSEIDLTSTLSNNVHTFPSHSSTTLTCADQCLVLPSTLTSNPEQPHRPFSHPSRLINRDLSTNYVNTNDVHPSESSPSRPSSTPVAITSPNSTSSFLTHNLKQTPSKLVASLPPSTDKTISENNVSVQDTTQAVDEAIFFKNESPSFPLVEEFDSLFNSGNSVQSDTNLTNERNVVHYSNQHWAHREVRSGLKRPHSATPNHTTWFDSDLLMRPLSAPKRLLEEAHVSSSLSSFLTTETNTPIPSITFSSQGVDAPKSTLEALVASTSPLMFFPHEFSIDLSSEDNTKVSQTAAKNPNTVNNSYNGLMQSVDESAAKSETDLNTNANSVSSSKSLASIDLSDPNVKGPDSSESSHKSGFSDFAINSDGISDHDSMVTSRINEYVQAMKTYVAELCPVDCVIFLEHCRPFNCDTIFMKYFRDQYLCPILSNLNGGPPLNADFGRDAYTSLYSLHGFCWRKPSQITALVPDTPIIYRILKRVATLQHESRHANVQLNESTSGYELLKAAVQSFDTIDRARRGLCKKVQRHLIILAVSPINLDNVRLSLSTTTASKSSTKGTGEDGVEEGEEEVNNVNSLNSFDPLTNLVSRGVALTVFSPVYSTSLLELYELINGFPAPIFHDRHWQTVALSKKLSQCDLPERRIIGSIAASYHAQTEAELQVLEQQQQQKQKQQLSKQLVSENSCPPQQKQQQQSVESNHHQQPTSQNNLLNKNSYHGQNDDGAVYFANNQTLNTTISNDSNSSIISSTISNNHIITNNNNNDGNSVAINSYSNSSDSPMMMMMISSSAPTNDAVYRPAQTRHNNNTTQQINGSASLSSSSSSLSAHQFNPNISPNNSYQRIPRSAPNQAQQRAAPTPPTQLAPPAPAYAGRGAASGRSVVENVRPVDGISQNTNHLSAGHSGPNSVDQAATGIYGSDSVTTPQSVYNSQTINLSPQQQSTTQLHSPIASGPVQATPPPGSQHASYNLYHSNANQMYHPYPQSVYDNMQGTTLKQPAQANAPTAAPASPNPIQIPFRPPSNTPSPGSQYNTNMQSMGLPSPCSGRNSNKQYSPLQQGSPQHRLTGPTGTPKSQVSYPSPDRN